MLSEGILIDIIQDKIYGCSLLLFKKAISSTTVSQCGVSREREVLYSMVDPLFDIIRGCSGGQGG